MMFLLKVTSCRERFISTFPFRVMLINKFSKNTPLSHSTDFLKIIISLLRKKISLTINLSKVTEYNSKLLNTISNTFENLI